MKDSLLSLLQTVRLIHTISQFYNTSERTSALMVKVNIICISSKYCKLLNKQILILNDQGRTVNL